MYLDEGRKLRWLALDNTGTVTHGKPAQTDSIALDNASPEHIRNLATALAYCGVFLPQLGFL